MHIHILGICGTFMTGIATLARSLGHEVTGSDTNFYEPMSNYLENMNIEVTKHYGSSQLKNKPDQVIVGNVMTRGHDVIESLLDSYIPFTSGPQWLNENILREKYVIAVTGTHGKTTTTSMLSWILEDNNYRPSFLIGGAPRDFDSSARLTASKFFVIEGDEYDSAFFDKRPKFIHYYPKISIINNIEFDLDEQVKYFEEIEKSLEAKRIKERTEFDLEMIKELGYCSGIENYSRYLDGRSPGTRPFCLLDYFPDDYLMVIDESHVTIPQVHAMYGGDRSRKENLVEYGFRLPAALDNRPLKFEEFEDLQNNVLYVSATPADYELRKSEGLFVEQIIRPTGVLDPIIEVRKSDNQIDDLIEEVLKRVEKDERVLVTTLTKRMAEELTKYLHKSKIRANYIHSDIDTLERVEIMQNLRKGIFDVLVGVNLLREGLDLPEVSLVAILDADKEGFLRSHRSLIQTVGRAARNINGKSIMYADIITESMKKTIDETKYRREKQQEFNNVNNLVPKQMEKSFTNSFEQIGETVSTNYDEFEEEIKKYHTKNQIEVKIRELRKEMEKVAKKLDFLKAADLRDKIEYLKKKIK